ncbi:uncharacterized protein ATC70_006891 [Mucor velutinosus]|uniref:Uncharacterized protein n=1 Tax=Mucor velutinosus TaxID=708070 RepID=A0AAN7DPV6_9FUNG|nr:hypothetical protein ATC70_006891 [Mucor velutinosus]
MASSTKDHNVRDPASSTDGTGTDSRHNPQNSSFTSQSWADMAKQQERSSFTSQIWADMAKQQERSSFNVTPTIDSAFDETNVQSYFTQSTPFLGATKDGQAPLLAGQVGLSYVDSTQPIADWATDGFSPTKPVGNEDDNMGEAEAATDMDLEKDSAGEKPNPTHADDQLQSSPEAPNGADGHQRQFNKDGSLNPGFRSRSGRAIKSPDRL